ncbi:MAG: LysM domain-containing protein, partial [Ilumatobacteraceae bacterium]
MASLVWTNMNLNPFLSKRRSTRRGRSALAAVVGASLVVVAPGPIGAGAGAGAASTRGACATAGAATYTVVSGDFWFGIALASGVSTSSLLSANSAVASASIFPGDVLCLPDGAKAPSPTASQAGCASKYLVVRGDSWFGISQ